MSCGYLSVCEMLCQGGELPTIIPAVRLKIEVKQSPLLHHRDITGVSNKKQPKGGTRRVRKKKLNDDEEGEGEEKHSHLML